MLTWYAESMSKARNTTGKGYFTVKGKEPLAKRAIAVRLPESLDDEVRRNAGKELSDWLRMAIIEQLKRDKEKLPNSGDKPC